jgi:hypothetical protein
VAAHAEAVLLVGLEAQAAGVVLDEALQLPAEVAAQAELGGAARARELALVAGVQLAA